MSTPRGDIPRIRRLQAVYHLPAGKGYPVSWWAGVNWRTGQGQYPEANGVYHALAHAHSRMVHIHVWGTANWHLGHSGKGSDDVDAQGFTHVSFVANILDAVRALFRAGGHVGSLRA